ncbi:hypothetical protein ACEZCY_16355 [Streptacidiphilus sp. N1-12]|uniref:Uncharacterized protein n=2 Tax=Streptacidiphilus alkalitolerans TaxID=3342712 RepID=A0ABV6VAM7_9ACTN
MTDTREVHARRLRRLVEMNRSRAIAEAGAALRTVWTTGKSPADVILRLGFIQSPGGSAPLVRLVLPQGVAQRFYLLALFEAQCRLSTGEPWVNDRPLTGVGSWSDFIAIDGAYDTASEMYMPDTKQRRNGGDLRLRQVKSALLTLEKLGDEHPERALVTVPKAKSGNRRKYAEFSLMQETGRGETQTPAIYTVPQRHWSVRTVSVPVDFFLKGWVQVLRPSEIATWLILRALSQWAADQHAKSGVYLYGKAREEDFGLRRDAWEDGCQRLRDFGLIRHARDEPLDSEPTGPFAGMVDLFAREGRERYEVYRWQVTDKGLAEDAVEVCLRELTLRQKTLDGLAKLRAAQKKHTPPSELG